VAELTFNLQCPHFQKTGLHAEAQLTWFDSCTWSHVDPGCVKTLFESRFGANLLDFRKLQFAKALISLKLKFGQFGFNLDLIRSLTFSHSLDPYRTSGGFWAMVSNQRLAEL
jgi:hypothetical protein